MVVGVAFLVGIAPSRMLRAAENTPADTSRVAQNDPTSHAPQPKGLKLSALLGLVKDVGQYPSIDDISIVRTLMAKYFEGHHFVEWPIKKIAAGDESQSPDGDWCAWAVGNSEKVEHYFTWSPDHLATHYEEESSVFFLVDAVGEPRSVILSFYDAFDFNAGAFAELRRILSERYREANLSWITPNPRHYIAPFSPAKGYLENYDSRLQHSPPGAQYGFYILRSDSSRCTVIDINWINDRLRFIQVPAHQPQMQFCD